MCAQKDNSEIKSEKKTFSFSSYEICCDILYISVSQPPGRGPVPAPGINYTGPQEVLLEFVILVA